MKMVLVCRKKGSVTIWCRLGVSALWTDLDRDDLGLEGGVLFIRIVLFLKIES